MNSDGYDSFPEMEPPCAIVVAVMVGAGVSAGVDGVASGTLMVGEQPPRASMRSATGASPDRMRIVIFLLLSASGGSSRARGQHGAYERIRAVFDVGSAIVGERVVAVDQRPESSASSATGGGGEPFLQDLLRVELARHRGPG